MEKYNDIETATIKKYEAEGFEVIKLWHNEYILMYNEITFKMIRIYFNGHIEGPY